MPLPFSSALSFPLSRLFGGTGEIVPRERYQEPTLQQTVRGVWFIRPWVDVVQDGKIRRAKTTISIGAMGKREAQARSREIMATINRSDYIVASQVNVGRFLDEYETMHVARLAASTQQKYRNHIRVHIRPAFGTMMLCDLQPLTIQRWLDGLAKPKLDGTGKVVRLGLSWATRTDIRNILSSLFTQASNWGVWKDNNPVERVHAGRKTAVREQRKLTDDETRRLLAALPGDVRLLCCVCLFGTLRISEALGLQEKHLDFSRGLILVRQRYSRGDIDIPKNDSAKRDIPMGHLADSLRALCSGDPERFVFQVETRPEWGKRTAICRDDRDLNQHFLRPAAQAVGCYWKGFGFHALRREAITSLGASLGNLQTMRIAGHSTADMSLLYTLADRERQEAAIRERQEKILGTTEGPVQ
jgi:integrase